MTVKINYKSNSFKRNFSNPVLFVGENFNIDGLKKHILDSEFSYIKEILKSSDIKKKLLTFKINSKKKIVLVSIKKNLKISDVESLVAEFYERIKQEKKSEYLVNT